MKRDQQFANIRRIYGPEKEAPGVLAIEVELVAELSTGPTGRTVTPIRTAGGGNPAVLSPLSPLAVPLLLKPRSAGHRHWPGDTAGYHPVHREFSLTEGAARELAVVWDLEAAINVGWWRARGAGARAG